MMKKAMIWGISLAFVVTGVRAQSLDDAKKAINAEQFAQAKGMLETLVKNKPKDGDNYFYLGLVHIQNEHLDSALSVFGQGLTADPKNNLNKVGQGIVDLYNEDSTAAATKFTEATAKLKRKDYLELYHIGQAYIEAPTPNYQKAVEYLDQAKAKNAEDPFVPLALGDAYFGLKNASMAFKNYRDAATLDNTLTQARVQMEVIKRGSHAWQEAIDGLKKISSEVPDFAPTYRELAETYHAWALTATDTATYNQRNRDAVGFYKQYMDKTDYTVESRIRYADFLVFAKDYNELQVQAAELAKVEDVNPKVLRYLGYSAYVNNQYQESKTALDNLFAKMEADRIIPLDYLHSGLVDVKLAATQTPTDQAAFDKGIAQLKKAVEMDSSIADDLHDAGLEFFSQKKYPEAASIFEIPASTPTARNYIFDNYYLGLSTYVAGASPDKRDTPEGKALLQKADTAFGLVIAKAPTTQEAYLYRARANALLDDAENPKGLSIPYFEKYIEVVTQKGGQDYELAKKNLVEIYNNLAFISTKQKDYQKARQYLTETLKIDPNNEYAKQTLEYLEQDTSANATGTPQQ
ncbi:tetratricopeptide repeat protein [Parapedobacter sp. DT-150]|uniref:tetratricopeptide repeat protein n=1 Tax=Parapedobacter sp. DT-150 TaxID=3396162 RepID=UPI003F1D3E68